MLNSITTYLNLALSLAQIIALFITYRLALKQFRMNKSSNYLERFLSKEFIILREAVDTWLMDTTVTAAQKVIDLNKEEQLPIKAQLVAFSNFFQELGVAYEHKLVDHHYIKEVFVYLATSYNTNLKFWIECYRKEKGRDTLFSDWDNLCKELKKRK